MRTAIVDLTVARRQWRSAGVRPPRLIIRRSWSRTWWWRCPGCADGVNLPSQARALAAALRHRAGARCRNQVAGCDALAA